MWVFVVNVCDRVNTQDVLILKIWVIILNTQKRSQRPTVQDFVPNWIMCHYEYVCCVMNFCQLAQKATKKTEESIFKGLKIHYNNSS